MNIKTTISLTEFRKNLFDIADRVRRPGTYYTLTEKGRPSAVLMSAEEFESWQETLEVMKDFPNLHKDLEKVKKEIKSGEYLKWPTFEEVLEDFGYVVRGGKVSKKNVISNNTTPKRGKRPGKISKKR